MGISGPLQHHPVASSSNADHEARLAQLTEENERLKNEIRGLRAKIDALGANTPSSDDNGVPGASRPMESTRSQQGHHQLLPSTASLTLDTHFPPHINAYQQRPSSSPSPHRFGKTPLSASHLSSHRLSLPSPLPSSSSYTPSPSPFALEAARGREPYPSTSFGGYGGSVLPQTPQYEMLSAVRSSSDLWQQPQYGGDVAMGLSAALHPPPTYLSPSAPPSRAASRTTTTGTSSSSPRSVPVSPVVVSSFPAATKTDQSSIEFGGPLMVDGYGWSAARDPMP